MSDWTVDQLRAKLATYPEIKGWSLHQENVHRRERYFLLDGGQLGLDQDRDVHQETLNLKIFVRRPQPGRQGEIAKRIFRALPLAEQLESAVAAARETDHQSWELPAPVDSAGLPALRTADPRMAEDLNGVMEEATARIARAVRHSRVTRFDSAELFLSVHDRELTLSTGVRHRTSQTRIYLESAYSYAQAGKSDEYLSTRWAVSLDDLGVENLFDETSERAHRSLDCDKPASGKYAVIVDDEVLATLFNGHLTQLSAANGYHGLPFLKVGREMIPGAQGDLVTLTLDPSLDFGANTAALSEQGVAQRPLRVVDKNRVVGTVADQQFASYLGIAPTTIRGNVVLEAGTRTLEELTREEPRVLEILQFSGLFSDANSGTFGSEIRLARLHETGKPVRYLKGGSLSGSVVENLRRARFSQETICRAHFTSGAPHGQGYFGPRYALLGDVSVAG